MKEIKEFVIDRNVWLRGKGDRASYLLRGTDGKMCCLGIYLIASGIRSENILDRSSPSSVNPYVRIPSWLKIGKESNSLHCQNLMNINDDIALSEEKREAKIANLFSAKGIKVTFR